MKKLPSHLLVADTGDLYDTRSAAGESTTAWSSRQPIRTNYSRTHPRIETTTDLKATLRAGEWAWPGGYPMFFTTRDGASLSFASVRKELRNILDSIKTQTSDGWLVNGCSVNWEDAALRCEHSGERIQSAYAEENEPANERSTSDHVSG